MSLDDGVGRVVEALPDGAAAVHEGEVAGIVEVGVGDALVGGVGLPDDGVRAVDQDEVAVGAELEGGGGADRGGGVVGVDGGPDADRTGVGDGREIEGGILGVGDEAEGEGPLVGGPGGVGRGEGGSQGDVCAGEGDAEEEKHRGEQEQEEGRSGGG